MSELLKHVKPGITQETRLEKIHNVIFDNSMAATRASSEIARTLSFFVSISSSLKAICCENASSHIIHSSGEIGLVPGSLERAVS